MQVNSETHENYMHVPFQVVNIVSSKVLWISNEFESDYGLRGFDIFKEKFSLISPDYRLRDGMTLDLSTASTLFAERYGGNGVGTNGGGARTGNLENFQLKGVGKNILAANTTDDWHSYGGLNLVDAVIETISYLLLKNILPIGCVKIYGIIITGDETAYLPGGKIGPGAILVREKVTRPGHFLPCPAYNVKEIQDIPQDSYRLRYINKILYKKFRDPRELAVALAKMASMIADQFGFSKIARIFHGSISASNLSIDGRWLDLTNCTFINDVHNYVGSTPFHAEGIHITSILEEWIYTIRKYNNLRFNERIILDYYASQLKSSCYKHIGYLFAIQEKELLPFHQQSLLLDFFNEVYSHLFTGNKNLVYGRPTQIEKDDLVVNFVTSVLVKYFNNRSDSTYFTSKFIKEFIVRKSQDLNIKEKNVHVAHAICSLKRLYLCEFYFIGRLEPIIYKLVDNKCYDQLEALIDFSTEYASWVFEDVMLCNTSRTVTVLDVDGHRLIYDVLKDIFYLYHKDNDLINEFFSFNEYLSFVLNPDFIVPIFGFDFGKYFEALASVLDCIDGLYEQ